MQDLKISLIQAALVWEDVDANLAYFSEKIGEVPQHTDIIILPEMFSTGFSMSPEKLAETESGKSVQWMRQQAMKRQCYLTGSLIITEGGHYYNRLFWVSPDGSYQTYNKKHLFSMAGEEKVYTPGTDKLMVEVRGWKICPMICFDLRFPVWIRNVEHYDVLLFVANWPERRKEHWRKLLQARAIENQAFVIGCNRVGEDGTGLNHTGNSMFCDPQGEILLELQSVEAIGTVSLKYDELTKIRRYMPFLKDRDQFELK